MQVRNVHERRFTLPPATVGALIDSLASHDDRLWPRDKWPPMRFDRPLSVGAVGGHGPVRYSVEEYRPGHSVVFRFTAPRGFNGTHRFDVEDRQGCAVLRHVIEMNATGPALLSWPIFFHPLARRLSRRLSGPGNHLSGDRSLSSNLLFGLCPPASHLHETAVEVFASIRAISRRTSLASKPRSHFSARTTS